MGDHQGKPGDVNLAPFVSVDYVCDPSSIQPLSFGHVYKMKQKPSLVVQKVPHSLAMHEESEYFVKKKKK